MALEFGGVIGGCLGAGLDPPEPNTGALLSFVTVFLRLVPAWIELNREFLPSPLEGEGDCTGEGILMGPFIGGIGGPAGGGAGGGAGADFGDCRGPLDCLKCGGVIGDGLGVGLDPPEPNTGALLSFVERKSVV